MPKNDDIYKLLITISEDIGSLKSQSDSIHEEVKKTNGRVTKLEQEAIVINTQNRISWAKVGWVGSIGLFILVAVFNTLANWIKDKIIN